MSSSRSVPLCCCTFRCGEVFGEAVQTLPLISSMRPKWLSLRVFQPDVSDVCAGWNNWRLFLWFTLFCRTLKLGNAAWGNHLILINSNEPESRLGDSVGLQLSVEKVFFKCDKEAGSDNRQVAFLPVWRQNFQRRVLWAKSGFQMPKKQVLNELKTKEFSAFLKRLIEISIFWAHVVFLELNQQTKSAYLSNRSCKSWRDDVI